ncbi:MAG TPA: DUF4333 domain-containing protein [Acidimicrobiales bacterium]|jgi:hypothetical protein|nr:DUF4333 domain-containing protein [Acidimicrobiales bacterium]
MTAVLTPRRRPPRPTPARSAYRREARWAATIGTLLVLCVVVVGCGSAAGLSTSKAETKIPSQLRQRYPGIEVGATTCSPKHVKRQAGVTFTCKLTVQGQKVDASVVQEDDHGNVSFLLDKVVLSVPKIQADLVTKFAKVAAGSGATGPPTASCPGDSVRVLDVYGSFRCSLTIAGEATQYAVLVCDSTPRLLYVAAASVTDVGTACQQGSGTSGGTSAGSPSTLPAS